MVQVGPMVVSLLALVLSLFNLYLQRRDRQPLLEIRARCEYRTGGLDVTPAFFCQSDSPYLHGTGGEV